MSYPFCFGFASTILDHHQNAFTAQEELVKTLFPNPTETEGVESRAWSAKYVIPLTCVWTAPFRVPPDLDPPPPLGRIQCLLQDDNGSNYLSENARTASKWATFRRRRLVRAELDPPEEL